MYYVDALPKEKVSPCKPKILHETLELSFCLCSVSFFALTLLLIS